MALARRPQRAEYRRLLEAELRSPEELAALQRDRALAIAAFAFANSPFYRDLYTAHGLRAADLHDPAVLAHLPIAEKAAVREGFERIRTPEATPKNSTPQATGGSTGRPTKVLHDQRAMQHLLAWRLHRWWGVTPADDRAIVWRSTYGANPRRDKIRELLAWPVRVRQLNANQLGEAEIRRFFEQWEKTRPVLLTGYVGAVLELARFVQDSGRQPTPPKAVALTSAPVSAGQKQHLREVFGAPVYDHYQCIEVPLIAGECEQADGQHVFSDARWLEIVDEQGRPVGRGETGDVVLTDLRNRVFPIVRYRLGDRASWKAAGCRCGRPFPVLNPIGGRITDNLYLPSGLVVAGEGMTAIFDPWPDAVRQFQLVQHADSSVTLRCVPGPDPRADELIRQVADGLRATVRGEVPVRLEIVDVIAHDRGKSRFILREAGEQAPAPGAAEPVQAEPVSASRSTPVATS